MALVETRACPSPKRKADPCHDPLPLPPVAGLSFLALRLADLPTACAGGVAVGAVAVSADFLTGGYQIIYNAVSPLGLLAEFASIRHRPNVYDLAKKLPAAWRMASDPYLQQIARLLSPSASPLLLHGMTLRIDKPRDPSHQTPWHQDAPYHADAAGITFLAPLQDMTPELGPLQIAAGSHRHGLYPLGEGRPAGSKDPYYRLIANEDEIISGFDVVAPLLAVGDVLAIDMDILHKSGANTSEQPRLTLVWRYVRLEPEPVPLSRRFGLIST